MASLAMSGVISPKIEALLCKAATPKVETGKRNITIERSIIRID